MNRKKQSELPTPREIVMKSRVLRGENQDVFGQRFQKTQSQISKYERGELSPPAEMIIQCMTYLEKLAAPDSLAPKRLAMDVEALDNTPSTLPLRRAIREMLHLRADGTQK